MQLCQRGDEHTSEFLHCLNTSIYLAPENYFTRKRNERRLSLHPNRLIRTYSWKYLHFRIVRVKMVLICSVRSVRTINCMHELYFRYISLGQVVHSIVVVRNPYRIGSGNNTLLTMTFQSPTENSFRKRPFSRWWTVSHDLTSRTSKNRPRNNAVQVKNK